jgi:hypothetical protein
MRAPLAVVASMTLLVPAYGCCTFHHCMTPEQSRQAQFSRLEQTLTEFSKKLNAYHALHGGVPSSFDAGQFFRELESAYPSGRQRKAAEELRASYSVNARPLPNGYFSVLVCDKSGRALMEDFSCLTTRVEVRRWESSTSAACEFAPKPETYCSPASANSP